MNVDPSYSGPNCITNQQREALQAVQDAVDGIGMPRIAIKSGQGPGKSRVGAIIALWFAWRMHRALAVVTAPTMKQCRDVHLAECRLLLEQAKDPYLRKLIKVTRTKVEIAGVDKWGVFTITATRPENAQGMHAKDMMVIVEEASGVSRELMTQFLGTLSNQNAILLLIGNPNTRDCMFFDCFTSQKRLWRTFTWNAEDTARDYPWLVAPERNRIFEEMFGRDSDAYRVRVLGEFPHTDPNSVISPELLQPCMEKSMLLPAARMARPPKYGGGIARQIGLDFARFGSDENVLFRRSGNALVEWAHFAHTDPSETVDLAFRWQAEAGWKDGECWYVADAGGMGQGVMHIFHRAGKRVVEFHNGGKAVESDYENKITEAWFNLARMIKAKECYIPFDQLLFTQLTNRKYFTTKKGKLILESKDEYMKRGFESPDRADACVLAMYDQVNVTGNIATGSSGKKAGVHVQQR